jgi:hypothetical protein
MTLKETLKQHLGKTVLITAIRERVPFEIAGVVEQIDDTIVLSTKRRIDQGNPIGQDPRTGQLIHQQSVTPQSTTYFGDIDMKDVIMLKVLEETPIEAKEKLDGDKTPTIHKPQQVVPGVFRP